MPPRTRRNLVLDPFTLEVIDNSKSTPKASLAIKLTARGG